jgi:hypothetical protein
MVMNELVTKIRELQDDKLQDCRRALALLRAHLPILFHLLPLSTVQRALQNEHERR